MDEIKGKIRKKYYLIVIDTGEEIELSDENYKNLFEAFADGSLKAQFPFKGIDGRMYIEQRHNVRMRETSEVVY